MTLRTELPFSGGSSRATGMQALLRWSLLIVGLVALLFVQSVRADVALRVQAQPVADPIQAFVTVTDTSGVPVPGLTAADFTVKLDGVVLASPPAFSLPPAQGPAQKVSVVFTMDYSPSVVDTSLPAMQQAVINFINSMKVGDYAAIVKFNNTNPNKASVVQQFLQIDSAGGPNRTALIAAVNADYPGRESNIFDGVVVSVDAFNSPLVTLPPGPRAIILVTDGAENNSSAEINTAVQASVDANISIFTVGVGDFTSTTSQQILNALPNGTGGDFYPTTDAATISSAYVQISQLLNNEYLLTFASTIADCNTHTLEVQVTGQAAAAANFTRCATTLVPDVRGMTIAEATATLTNVGLVVGTVTDQDSTSAIGSIIAQSPSVGAVVNPGSAVNLTRSVGVPVPIVVGLTEASARTTITAAGLKVGTVTRQTSTNVASGNVISQNPAGATRAPTGSSVDLVVSSGLPPVTVPNVLNLTQAAASTAIAGAGLVVGTVTQQSSATVPAGSVISQNPNAGTNVAAGSAVALVVSTSPVPPALPTVALSPTFSSIEAGATSTLTWSSTNATSCAASGGWTGVRATSGSETTSVLSATTSFTLTCTGPGGTASNTVSVTVTTPPSPTVSLSVSPASIAAGATTTLTWSSTNATACTASNGWSGARVTSGSDTIGALSATTSFTLTCTGPGGTGSQTVTVSVTPPPKKSGGGGATDYALLAMLLGAGFRFARRSKGRY